MCSFLYPGEYLDSTYRIDFDRLYNEGYRGIIFDIDNTLVPHGAPADERAILLFAHLKELGFQCMLLSNNITSISINEETGQTFFGTDKGLCSYYSDSSKPNEEMTKDNVYAYPNPVEPSYNGLVTVVGLSMNTNIKIVTSSGQIVNEGKSNGGTYTWDVTDKNGKRVSSGVYNVITATSDGKKGTVCKIAVIN